METLNPAAARTTAPPPRGPEQRLSKLARWMGWLALVHAVLTAGLCAVALVMGWAETTRTLVVWSTLGVIGAVAAIHALRGRAAGFWWLFCLYLVQLADYWSPGTYVSFMSPIVVDFGWGSASPPRHFDLNLLALAACMVALACARNLGSRQGQRAASR